MKATRRGFLGALVAGAAALGLPVSAAAAEAAEAERIREILANPEQYPELMAQVRELMGLSPGAVGSACWNLMKKDMQALAAGHQYDVIEGIHPSDVRWMDARLQEDTLSDPPLTFEAMQADCAARGCTLAQSPYVGDESRFWYWHRHPGQPHPVDQLVGKIYEPLGLAQVEAWRRSLHESEG